MNREITRVPGGRPGRLAGWTALFLLAASPPGAAQQAGSASVEFRSYNLKPGARTEFHRLVVATLPLLQRWKIDVVGYGPSPHDSTSYVLIRAFRSIEERERAEAAFYGSREWLEGPRQQVLALIESYTTVVIPLDSVTVAGLRSTMHRLR